MHRRRSRSPIRLDLSPSRSRNNNRPLESFSISSLSDCSIGNTDIFENRNSDKSKDRHKRRHSRNHEKHVSDRDKKVKKNPRDIEGYKKFDQDNSLNQGNDAHDEQVGDGDPSVFGESQVQYIEPSYIQQKTSVPSDDRLGRLEKMVETLVQNNLNKSQSLSLNYSQEIYPTCLEGISKGPQFIASIWLNRVNEECLERNFDEITCIEFMQSKMPGLMKAWFKTLDIYQYTWPELKMIVIKTFPDTVDFANTLRMIVDRVKRPDETFTQYYFSKMYLLEACKISGPNAVSCLIDGLSDHILQKEAKEHCFLTPETLYTQFLSKLTNFGFGNIMEQDPILELRDNGVRDPIMRDRDAGVRNRDIGVREKDALVRERDAGVRGRDFGVRERDVGVRDRDSAVRNLEIEVQDHREREEYFQREDYKKRDGDTYKKCYTCNKMGHISENCRHAPICYKCRQKGHIAAKCPN